MEELADDAVKELRGFLDTELQLVKEGHELSAKLQSWDNVIGHLDERLPAKAVELHKLSGNITKKLLEIRNFVEENLQNLEVLNENKQTLELLEESVEHRDWKAVKTGMEDGQKIKRLNIDELKELHSKLIDLMKITKRSNLIKALNDDLTDPKEKKEYEKLEEYYFVQLYKFARAYERIFRHLWRKERRLEGIT